MLKIQVLGDFILLKMDSEYDQTEGGIYYTPSSERKKQRTGTIVSVGQQVPTYLTPGMRVPLEPSTTRTNGIKRVIKASDNHTYLLVREWAITHCEITDDVEPGNTTDNMDAAQKVGLDNKTNM